MPTPIKRVYSWRPDLPDQRDFQFAPQANLVLPPKVDLRTQYAKVYDQNQVGACTANSAALAYDFEKVKQHLPPILPSRLFTYFVTRTIEGTTSYDSGATIRDTIKACNKTGMCPESLWPYVISKYRVKPPTKCYTNALGHKVKQYLSLNSTSLNDLKSCLAQGFPFIIGFSVYSSFESPQVEKTGIVPMPAWNESLLGGHAVVCLGYSSDTQRFICRNSWGSAWGDKGHFTIPFEYLLNQNLADDFWTIRLV